MDERRQAKCGNEEILSHVMIDGVTVNMTVNVTGNGVFWPAPFLQGRRIELQFARRRREAFVDLPINRDTNRSAITRNRAAECIDISAFPINGSPLTPFEGGTGRLAYGYFNDTM